MITTRKLHTMLCGVLLLTGLTSQPAIDAPITSATSLIGSTIGLDHLIWSKDPAAAEATLVKQLGFKLGPAGSYDAGIANKLVRFNNRSFIEFLWLSDPKTAKESARWAYDFVTQHNGSNSFGVQVESVDSTYAALMKGGLKPDEPTSEAWDPDGPDGPKAPITNQWRFMFLAPDALPGDPFFVEYHGRKQSQQSALQPSVQPNGARKLSAVWVLVQDLEAARQAYQHAGFSVSRNADFTVLHGKGISLNAGDGNIVLVTPTGDGPLRDRLRARGQHVAGISIQVADLDVTARMLEAEFGNPIAREKGPFGVALRPPTVQSLGLWIEFHE